MKTFVQEGKNLALAAPYDRLSGQGALVGSIFGIATVDVLSGVTASFLTEGVATLAKTSAQAWSQGDSIYWDDTAKRADNTVVGPLIGSATDAAANPSSTGSVKLKEAPAKPPQANEPAIATANATDLATSEALANALKVTVNSLITKLHAAGITL